MTDEREIEDVEPDYRHDGSAELSRRATFRLLFNVPAIRNYLFAAFGSLVMIALMLLEQGSDSGAILIVFVGVCGVLLQFRAAPVLVLLILSYFMWTPTGIPGDGFSYPYMIESRRFHIIDVLLVLSTVVYVVSQYRIFGLAFQAMAFESGVRRHGEPPTRRPASLIRPTELSAMLGLSVVLVLAGQLIWFFTTSVQVAPTHDFPLQIAESRSSLMKKYSAVNPSGGPAGYVDPRSLEDRHFQAEGVLSPGVSRFFVLLGMLVFGTLLTALVFRDWRLRTIEPTEGAMILLNAGWEETSRERVRLEKWRIWGRKRAATQAQLPEHRHRGKSS
jgi:hypothetical protein